VPGAININLLEDRETGTDLTARGRGQAISASLRTGSLVRATAAVVPLIDACASKVWADCFPVQYQSTMDSRGLVEVFSEAYRVLIDGGLFCFQRATKSQSTDRMDINLMAQVGFHQVSVMGSHVCGKK